MEKGHKKEFKEAIELMKERGFIISLNPLNYDESVIYQYDFDTKRFQKKSKSHLMDLWSKLYTNSYGRDYSFIEIIRSLNTATRRRIDNYHTHLDFLQQTYNLEDMQRLTELLLNKNNARKNDFNTVYWGIKYQVQQLINKDVFFDNGIFYRYNGKRFIYINDRLFSVFNDAPYVENLSPSAVKQNKSAYAKFLTNGNGIISDWFDYDLQQRRLQETQSDYDAIMELIKTFE